MKRPQGDDGVYQIEGNDPRRTRIMSVSRLRFSEDLVKGLIIVAMIKTRYVVIPIAPKSKCKADKNVY